jgi:hypothetical protein
MPSGRYGTAKHLLKPLTATDVGNRAQRRDVDEARVGETVFRTTHRVQRIDSERSRVTHRMEISGAGADSLGPQIGPEISGDFRRCSPN